MLENIICAKHKSVTLNHLCPSVPLSPPLPHCDLQPGPQVSWCSTAHLSAGLGQPASVGLEPRGCIHTVKGAPNIGCHPASQLPVLYWVIEAESEKSQVLCSVPADISNFRQMLTIIMLRKMCFKTICIGYLMHCCSLTCPEYTQLYKLALPDVHFSDKTPKLLNSVLVMEYIQFGIITFMITDDNKNLERTFL